MLGLLNRSRRWLPGVLAGIGLAIHVAPLCYGDWEFIYSFDDGANFVENPMIQALTLPNIVAMATTVKINVYEPLSWLLKAFVHGLVGMQSKYVRMVSVLVHWTACGILGCATHRLLAPSFPDRASVAIAASLSAILFAIHPVHIEVLMWPSAQPYPLAMLFTSIMFLAHLHKPWSIVGTVAYVCAVLSKSIALFTPVGLVLLDLVRGHLQLCPPKHLLPYLRKMSVCLVLSMALVATTYVANQRGAGTDVDTISLTIPQRLAKVFIVSVWPIQAWLWPVNLRPHYQIPDPTALTLPTNPNVVFSVLIVLVTLVAGLTTGLATTPASNWTLLASTLYMLTMVLPVSGLVQHGMVSLTADRYSYFATVVFIRVPLQALLLHRVGQRWATVVALTVFGLWGSLSTNQLQAWRSEEALWLHSLIQDPSDWRLLNQLAEYYLHHGRNADAVPLMEESIWFGPTLGFKATLFQAKQRMFLNRVTDGCSMYSALSPQRC
ncbi:hypothetical protein H257_13985 [Aphanomyces astaci]|uniref:DUF1736 domain-containing protein n=1 Tax=Aphanomyces astaci TaxID=112090 RepID=W4FT32_APHAT|nr:hypothetical protein H257_13985 [Aphanomyces astaci]ETV70612.1 hypothetical protein H257_13985 [Aphanomyces astaci]|eukprot:XP_009839995.1 hypothetical protein H257_13985 [Aphanomyces astaci]